MITKIIDEDKIQNVKKNIEIAGEIVIITHLSPDGDAIGASLGFYHFLLSLEKKVTIIVPNTFPDFLKWMPGISQIIVYQEKKAFAEDLISRADLLFAFDFNVLTRIGEMMGVVADSPAVKILVDHHLNPGCFADVIISYPQISSTSEMIFRIICRMGFFTRIDKKCAECIYTGMMTDTGSFTYNSNNPEIYIIISELIKKGINKDEIYNKVYNNFSADRFRLMGHTLEKMKVYPEYGTVLITLTKDELNRFQYKKGDTEGFVNLPLSIEGIVFTIFFKEDSDKIKISLRSRGLFPVNQFASSHFNGGGHLNASGGESYVSMEDTIKLFEEVLPQYKEMLQSEIKRQKDDL
jgi:phosphoesterase RecJ-like protein